MKHFIHNNSMRRLFKAAIIGTCSCLLIVNSVRAVDIYTFYVPGDQGISCVGASNAGGALDYAGRPIFTSAQLDQIALNQPFYENSANKYNIPWQMLAVIHSNEHNLLRENPANGQGIYQFFDKRGGPYPAGPVSDAEFQRQTDIAAELLVGKVAAGKTLSSNSSEIDVVKDTFFGYNGRAEVYVNQSASLGYDPSTQGFEGSPYVMNKADLKRDPAVEPTKSNGTWGQIKRDKGPIEYPANDFYGAFTAYAALAGISYADGNCGPAGSSAFVQNILRILEEELAAGANERDGSHTKYGGSPGDPWCGFFVSWVFDKAGNPFEVGPLGAVAGIRDYAIERGIFYAPDDPSFVPQPGDVAIYKNEVGGYKSHVHFVISYDPTTKTYVSIGGNEDDSVKRRTNSMDSISLTGFMRR